MNANVSFAEKRYQKDVYVTQKVGYRYAQNAGHVGKPKEEGWVKYHVQEKIIKKLITDFYGKGFL